MSIASFLNTVNTVILNPLLEVLFAVAMIYFIYAVIKLISAPATGKDEARNSVMYALLGMFIMISVYGIFNLVLGTFQINDSHATSYIQDKLSN